MYGCSPRPVIYTGYETHRGECTHRFGTPLDPGESPGGPCSNVIWLPNFLLLGRRVEARPAAGWVGEAVQSAGSGPAGLYLAGFDELMPKTLAVTVDRLLHHSHICQTSGDPVRLSQALTGKGVTPLI